MKKIHILLFFILILSSCLIRKIGGTDKFIAKPYKNNNKYNVSTRNNGAFISQVNVNDSASHYLIWFLYSNGTTLSYYCKINKPLNEITQLAISSSITEAILTEAKYFKNKKTAGGYVINSNKIKLQEYQIGHYGIYDLCEYNGIIINDTTINITSIYFGKNTKDYTENKNLKFHYLKMLKPDSTNQWMKKNWYWAKEKY